MCVSAWDVGCDDCGEYDTVESEHWAVIWVETHVCEEEQDADTDREPG